MKRRLTCCLAALVCLVFSCKEEPKAEELAAKAAENYYRLLMNGHYDRFVDGIADADSLPAIPERSLQQGFPDVPDMIRAQQA